MSPPNEPPIPYRVVYSELVRRELIGLLRRAMASGLGRQTVQAVQDADARLRIYPQFGEPLYDLAMEEATIWLGTVPPLVIQYMIDEQRRLVFVVQPMRLLPHSGIH